MEKFGCLRGRSAFLSSESTVPQKYFERLMQMELKRQWARKLRRLGVWASFFILGSGGLWGESGLVWPTPNPAFQEGHAPETFIQPTASGRLESGLFGCVRNGGRRFHEGIDLFPIFRDRRREATDPIYAVLPGRVAYISSVAWHSSYGRYVIVEHPQVSPPIHTLYAHLARVDSSLQVGQTVQSGTVLGVMGRSAGGYTIPRERAHLHFEIGFRLSDDFQSWFDQQGFGSENYHGVWNGMNLMGVDPLDFYEKVRRGEVQNIDEFLAAEPIAATLRVVTSQTPDFIRRYPNLLERSADRGNVVAWDIAFTWYGLPLRWNPRFAGEGFQGNQGDVQVLRYHRPLIEGQACRRLLTWRSGRAEPSAQTLTTLKKIFGFQ